jgi:hypothetical protein
MRRSIFPIIALLSLANPSYANQIYEYKEVTGNKTIEVSWGIIKETENTIVIQSTNTKRKEQQFVLNRKDGSTLKWTSFKKDRKFEAIRKENTIFINLEKNGGKQKNILKIGKIAWMQVPEFCLIPFVKNEGEKKSSLAS